jgi:putative glutamine amidotransferase
MMSKKPLIGVTFDTLETGEFSTYPWYGLRQYYCLTTAKMGGIPFPLIHDHSLIESYLSLIDGLIVTGGGHDIDPTLYGESEIHPTVTVKPQRTAFEIAITKAALQKNIPVLGICGGQQVLNVALGGSLIQHIPEEIPTCVEHLQKNCRTQPAHTVKIAKETLLYSIVGKEEIDVNSMHHQAVKAPGLGLKVNAYASDGVIEGIEAPAYRFCLGLQWHPEFLVTPFDGAIFKAFLEAACA